MPSAASSSMPPDRAGLAFVVVTVAIATATFAAGWLSDLRLAADAALASVALFAFLPVVLVIVAFALGTAFYLLAIVLAAAFAAHFGVDALGALPAAVAPSAATLDAADRFVPWYYRMLRRIRHPFLWAVPAGLFAGGVALALLLVAHVWPAESRTAESLLEARSLIERAQKATGQLPAPTADGRLEGAPPDGFGRPLVYETRGAWKLASWRVHSLGFDGRPGRDDLCTEGRTAAMGAVDALVRLGAWLADRRAARPAARERFAAARALRCR